MTDVTMTKTNSIFDHELHPLNAVEMKITYHPMQRDDDSKQEQNQECNMSTFDFVDLDDGQPVTKHIIRNSFVKPFPTYLAKRMFRYIDLYGMHFQTPILNCDDDKEQMINNVEIFVRSTYMENIFCNTSRRTNIFYCLIALPTLILLGKLVNGDFVLLCEQSRELITETENFVLFDLNRSKTEKMYLKDFKIYQTIRKS